jgi:hypothetical protein
MAKCVATDDALTGLRRLRAISPNTGSRKSCVTRFLVLNALLGPGESYIGLPRAVGGTGAGRISRSRSQAES